MKEISWNIEKLLLQVSTSPSSYEEEMLAFELICHVGFKGRCLLGYEACSVWNVRSDGTERFQKAEAACVGRIE